MAIPDYETLMLPALQFLGDEKEHTLKEIVEHLANRYQLTEEERTALLPSGTQRVFYNRVGWAITYMKRAGLLEAVARGTYRIRPVGTKTLSEKPDRIDNQYLSRFPSFLEFRQTRHEKKNDDITVEEESAQTPLESIESIYREIKSGLVDELLQAVKSLSPSFFERLVVDLLLKMGYGGSREDAGKAVGKSGDEGIDGIINEDRLGLDTIYIQAKKWEATIGRPEIQKFAGALQGARAKKGIFITTSDFSKEAREYVSRIDIKIVLIGGEELANLMIENNIGISVAGTYEIKRIDSDYFSEE